MKKLSLTILACAAALMSGFLTGCSDDYETAYFMRYPEFWSDSMSGSTVFVAPFSNYSEIIDMEREVRYEVVKELASRGSYNLVNDNSSYVYNVEDYLAQRSAAGDSDYVIFGSLFDFQIAVTEDVVVYEDEVYDDYGNLIHTQGEVETTTSFDGYAKLNVSMYKVSNGHRIYNRDLDVDYYYSDINLSERDIDEEVNYATDILIDDLSIKAANELSPYSIAVKYEYGDFIQSATSFRDGNWKKGKKFERGSSVFAVINLPKNAAHNSFNVEILRRDTNEILISRPFTWNSAYMNFNVEIPVNDFYQPGVKKYELRLSQGGEMLDYQNIEVKE